MKMRLLIFLVFSQYGLAFNSPNINIQLDAELHFLIPGVIIANQTRL